MTTVISTLLVHMAVRCQYCQPEFRSKKFSILITNWTTTGTPARERAAFQFLYYRFVFWYWIFPFFWEKNEKQRCLRLVVESCQKWIESFLSVPLCHPPPCFDSVSLENVQLECENIRSTPCSLTVHAWTTQLMRESWHLFIVQLYRKLDRSLFTPPPLPLGDDNGRAYTVWTTQKHHRLQEMSWVAVIFCFVCGAKTNISKQPMFSHFQEVCTYPHLLSWVFTMLRIDSKKIRKLQSKHGSYCLKIPETSCF